VVTGLSGSGKSALYGCEEHHIAAGDLERNYKRYRQKQVASSVMEAWLEKVMVEQACPDCEGARLRENRKQFRINDRTVHEFGELNFDDLRLFLDAIQRTGQTAEGQSHSLPVGRAHNRSAPG